MKKIFIFMLCITSLFLITGCGNKYEKKIWGTWKTSSVNVIYNKTISTIITFDIKKDGNYNYTLNINGDNTTESTGTYKIKDNIITLTFDNDDSVWKFEYDDDKDILYLLKDDIRTGEKYERK